MGIEMGEVGGMAALGDLRFRTLYEDSDDAIMLSQPDGVILDCNGAALRVFEAPSKECFVARPAKTYFSEPAERAKYMEIFREKGFVHNVEVRYETYGGRPFWGLASGKLLKSPGGHAVIITWLRDITERKDAEALIEKQNRDLRSLSDDKDRLISILAHDLRGAFQHINGYAELLLSRLGPGAPDGTRGPLKLIAQTSWNAHQVFEDLLLWAQSGTGHLVFETQRVRLADLCLVGLSEIEAQAIEKNLELIGPSPDGREVLADPRMLRVILRNLLSNAVKFSGPGGEIAVTLSWHENRVDLSVADSGIGMSPHQVESLWDPSRRRPQGGVKKELGSGLGLLLCKDFAGKHGGHVFVESCLGEGSTFTLSLPL